MAIGNSGLYLVTWKAAIFNTRALNLDLETHRIALFSNTVTPVYATDTAYAVAPYNANEVTGTNWSAGGQLLTATTVDIASFAGNMVWDAADISVASTTITAARGGLIYDDASAGNEAIAMISFGADFSTVNGTFGIQWAAPASGAVFYIDLTP